MMNVLKEFRQLQKEESKARGSGKSENAIDFPKTALKKQHEEPVKCSKDRHSALPRAPPTLPEAVSALQGQPLVLKHDESIDTSKEDKENQEKRRGEEQLNQMDLEDVVTEEQLNQMDREELVRKRDCLKARNEERVRYEGQPNQMGRKELVRERDYLKARNEERVRYEGQPNQMGREELVRERDYLEARVEELEAEVETLKAHLVGEVEELVAGLDWEGLKARVETLEALQARTQMTQSSRGEPDAVRLEGLGFEMAQSGGLHKSVLARIEQCLGGLGDKAQLVRLVELIYVHTIDNYKNVGEFLALHPHLQGKEQQLCCAICAVLLRIKTKAYGHWCKLSETIAGAPVVFMRPPAITAGLDPDDLGKGLENDFGFEEFVKKLVMGPALRPDRGIWARFAKYWYNRDGVKTNLLPARRISQLRKVLVELFGV